MSVLPSDARAVEDLTDSMLAYRDELLGRIRREHRPMTPKESREFRAAGVAIDCCRSEVVRPNTAMLDAVLAELPGVKEGIEAEIAMRAAARPGWWRKLQRLWRLLRGLGR